MPRMIEVSKELKFAVREFTVTTEVLSPVTVKIQAMLLYGPHQWFDVTKIITKRSNAAQERKEEK